MMHENVPHVAARCCQATLTAGTPEPGTGHISAGAFPEDNEQGIRGFKL